MKRRLFNLLAGLLLLLIASTGVLWVRSYWTSDVVSVAPPSMFDGGPAWSWRTSSGVCNITCVRVISPRLPRKPNTVEYQWSRDRTDLQSLASPWIYSDQTGSTLVKLSFGQSDQIKIRQIYFPLRNLCLLLAIPIFLRLAVVFHTRRRFRVGQCANCRYDLRATTGRCPECGAAAG